GGGKEIHALVSTRPESRGRRSLPPPLSPASFDRRKHSCRVASLASGCSIVPSDGTTARCPPCFVTPAARSNAHTSYYIGNIHYRHETTMPPMFRDDRGCSWKAF